MLHDLTSVNRTIYKPNLSKSCYLSIFGVPEASVDYGFRVGRQLCLLPQTIPLDLLLILKLDNVGVLLLFEELDFGMGEEGFDRHLCNHASTSKSVPGIDDPNCCLNGNYTFNIDSGFLFFTELVIYFFVGFGAAAAHFDYF